MSAFEALWKTLAVLLLPMILLVPFHLIGLHAIGVVIYALGVWIGCLTLANQDR